jgi:hypothetical protein
VVLGIVTGFPESRYREGRLRANASEPESLQTMIGPNVWRDVYKMSVNHDPETGVSYLLEQVKTAVKTFMWEPPLGEQAVLPRLADLLAEAVGRDTGAGITQDYRMSSRTNLPGCCLLVSRRRAAASSRSSCSTPPTPRTLSSRGT